VHRLALSVDTPQEPMADAGNEPGHDDSEDVNAICPVALRADILDHWRCLGLVLTDNQLRAGQNGQPSLSKDGIRFAHAKQREAYLAREAAALCRKWPDLLAHFADGREVNPEKIQPELVPVESNKETGNLFRLATTLWSVPVSRGFGRRMRYLVRDQANGKLIGIFALGDPVFNLKARDNWIGWNIRNREKRLVNTMDAYIVGAMPPYSQLLGGKLVTALIGSREVAQAFWRRYGQTTGIISNQRKRARLTLVTVTSALGRSSLYNRLHLRAAPNPFCSTAPTLVRLKRVGSTLGYGHFHLSEDLFDRLRRLLIQEKHDYANKHQFGDGPNWRLRVARVALERLGLSPDLVRHGIQREVFVMPMADNARAILKGETRSVAIHRPTAENIAEAALLRWVIPRAKSRPNYQQLVKEDYFAEQLALSR
jgi:hypothetical protein